MIKIIDNERAEGLLFLANYSRNINALDTAESYCCRSAIYEQAEYI